MFLVYKCLNTFLLLVFPFCSIKYIMIICYFHLYLDPIPVDLAASDCSISLENLVTVTTSLTTGNIVNKPINLSKSYLKKHKLKSVKSNDVAPAANLKGGKLDSVYNSRKLQKNLIHNMSSYFELIDSGVSYIKFLFF